MSHQHDNRLSARTYFATLEGVEIQFALIRFALSTLSRNAVKGFFKARLQCQLDTNRTAYAMMKAISPDDKVEQLNQLEETVRAFIKKKHRQDSKPSDARFKIEFSEDRLNQSELLLLVAHFESFMKEVHQTFLTAAPGKVFGKRQKEFKLCEVFQDGFTKFLDELIIKEVKYLDSQRVKHRAEYFSVNFGVSFGSQNEIDDLKEIMETRNKISHEIYFSPPRSLEHIKGQPLVPDEMLDRARRLFRDIPKRCIEAGVKVHPSYFRKGVSH